MSDMEASSTDSLVWMNINVKFTILDDIYYIFSLLMTSSFAFLLKAL